MQIFRSQDMQRNVAAIQEAALTEPVLITYHDRPRLVLMSMDEYARLRGRKRFAGGIHDIDAGLAAELKKAVDEALLEEESAEEMKFGAGS